MSAHPSQIAANTTVPDRMPVTLPKLFIHARADRIIPLAHGQRLFQLASPPKDFQEVGGDHTTAFQIDPAFFTAVARFVDSLGLPTPGAALR